MKDNKKKNHMPKEELALSRRNLFALAGWTGLLASFAGALGTSLRFLVPNVLYEPSPIVTLGRISDYSEESVTLLEAERMFIVRTQEGIRAISAICTHLGCTVNWSEKNNHYECPCHGSIFNTDGKVIAGPAPRPLSWFDVKYSPGKRLVVNKRRLVSKDDYLIV